MRRLPGIAVAAALAALTPQAVGDRTPEAGPTARRSDAPESRQAVFARVARTYGVPESVLLAVAYLESRWDANNGLPSVSAGYGPMHLVDGRLGPELRRHDTEDPRGDERRPRPPVVPAAQAPPPEDTLHRAAELTGITPARLRRDPAANIEGGAALLADHQRRIGAQPAADPARWYGAVARYPGTTGTGAGIGAADSFADEVYATIRTGAARVTDDGERVVLRAIPDLSPPRLPTSAGLRRAAAPAPDCPPALSCEWMPAAYRRLKQGGYGNHDRYDAPRPIDYIVIHDGETGYDAMTRLSADPTYLSWHYTLRSSDGHIAQHLRGSDIGWHAGNWYVNSRSIGLEHEGYLARGAWYTESMYRSSARLVAYLARKYQIPLDRAHIIGHDNVPGTTPETVRDMHSDPGPYWDWRHYFELLGSPLTGSSDPTARSVLIRPDYARNRARFTGCAKSGTCPSRSTSSVWLHSRPSEEAPLVRDVGKHPTDASTYSVYDQAARASTGQRYALAGRRGDWTAIWYLGQKAWFHDPAAIRTSVPATGRLVTPRSGLTSVKVYGRAYPDASAYPRGVPPEKLTPLQYTLPAGQFYSLGMTSPATYLRAGAFDPSHHRIIRGDTPYRQIQFGHRIMFVRAADVRVISDEDRR
ncbi:N-acetylmuramoyl-L-alanine amidase [Streptosporangium sp. NBC_01639]|uniref:N-acetylmuramoyl-L-alanine amidase n=1 Tax=Streptosporangium sp. NBC_01639 TaxID=2975948 RepID=UPI00386DA293|nr:N-acetylmuramoyl-L-alanine amidase [Streptosporangium sp. NBC_01639]